MKGSSSRVAAAWRRIEQALDPASRETLNQHWLPAKSAECRNVEKQLGVKLPADFRESVTRHHEPNAAHPIGALALFGLENSLKDGLKSSLLYAAGPMQSRFSNDGASSYPGPTSEFGGFLHLFTHDEDRNYFFLCLDLLSSAVVYVDFGDLVGDVQANVLAWTWTDYLEAVAAALERTDSPLNWFPEPSFGFSGMERILGQLFPACCDLQIASTGSSQLDSLAPIRSSLDACRKNPLAHPKWEEPKPKTGLKDLSAGVAWSRDPFSPIVGAELSNDGLKARTRNYNFHMEVDSRVSFGSPIHSTPMYYEFRLGAGTIYYVGLYWKTEETQKIGMMTTPCSDLFIGLESTHALHSQYNKPALMQGGQWYFGDSDNADFARFNEGDTVGILVDESAKSLSFFLNGRQLGKDFPVAVVSDVDATCGIVREFENHDIIVRNDMVFSPCVFGHQFEVERNM